MHQLPIVFSRMFFIMVLLGGTATNLLANQRGDRTTERARQAVEEASPDDWHTLARSAKLCIAKGVNLKEAAGWLKQSLDIKETPYNLCVQGDYYVKNRLPEQALESYSKSIRVGKISDPSYADAATQKKILRLVRQKG
ncbi:MAG: hypothetical protein WA958_09980 [Tunicatimonas sp.]